MRKFLIKILSYCCFLLVSALLLQLLIAFKIKNNNLTANDNLQDTEQINADLVLFGSSRSWAHFDPVFFEKTFNVKSVNIGLSGHSEIDLIQMRLENYLATNKPPKYAILNFDPFVKADATNKDDNFVLKNNYARYAFLPRDKDVPMLDYFKFTAEEKYVPLYALFKYKLLKDCLFPKKNNYYTQYGYERNEERWDTVNKPPVDFMKKHFFKNDDLPKITHALKQLQILCNKHKIKLLCIQTPVYKVIYEEAVFLQTSEIPKKLGITYVDANIPEITNDVNCFYNSNHMNTYGVEKMNVWLQNNSTIINFFNSKIQE